MIRKFYDMIVDLESGGGKIDEDQGKRYNQGKTRYDLIEPFALEQLAKVFTKGAEKYEEHNWLKGMKWSKVLASLKRHIAKFEKGEDFDDESELPHMAHAAWNAMALISYMKYYPKGDDRLHNILPDPRIGLDIDDVVCTWVDKWCERYKIPLPTSWYFEWDTLEKFRELNLTGELKEFYLNLPPKIKAEELPFEPVVYITHRPVDVDVTKEWLRMHGFPLKPVISVNNREDKLKVAKEYKLDIFVDDNYDTFKMMNANGIACYLLDAKHNQRYQVGYKRINSLKELM